MLNFIWLDIDSRLQTNDTKWLDSSTDSTRPSRSRKESEVSGWSRIPKNTRNRSQIFYLILNPAVQLNDFYIALLCSEN